MHIERITSMQRPFLSTESYQKFLIYSTTVELYLSGLNLQLLMYLYVNICGT